MFEKFKHLASLALLAIMPLILAADYHTTLPAQNSSFYTNLTTFLSNEDSMRTGDQSGGFLFTPITGGLHATNPASLTATPTTWSGYTNGGWYLANVTGSVTYQNNSTCWLIANQATTGNLGSFQRQGSTHYLTDCRATVTDPPELPTDSLPLALIVTSAGGIFSVTDMRPLGGPGGWVDVLDFESIEAAITFIGSTYPTTLLIRSRTQVSTGLLIPKNVSTFIPRGGLIEVVPGAQLTFGVAPEAGRYQIFSTGSVIVFQNYAEVFPEWWGALAGDTTSDTTAISAAVTALPWAGQGSCGGVTSPCGGVVSLAAGSYVLGTTLNINSGTSSATNRGEIILRGQSQRSTILAYTGGATAIILAGFDISNPARQITLQGFTLFDSGAIGLRGISLEYVTNVRITDVRINNFYSLNPGVRGLEGIDTGGSQNVNIASEGYAIRGQNTSNVEIANSTFINDNIGFYCETTCENTIIGPHNVFNSADGVDNAAIALIGPLSRTIIRENNFENGLSDSEGEIFIWNVDEVTVEDNFFQSGDSDHWIYSNQLTTAATSHSINILNNYFAVGEFGDTGSFVNDSIYIRNTATGRIEGNVFEGSSLYANADIELGPGTSRFVISGNEAFLGSATVGVFAGGSTRPISISDSRSSAIQIGATGIPVGQIANPSLYVPGTLSSSAGGFSTARINFATDSSFETGTAVLSDVGGATSTVLTSGWHSNEGVATAFPVGGVNSTDRVEYNNTSQGCVIGDYFNISFAASNSSGSSAARDDITFEMAGSETLGSFIPQLDTTFNRYSFTTGRCLAVGTVELRAYQNTAQTAGALSLRFDAVQIERNVSSPSPYIPTRAVVVNTFEGLGLSHGSLFLSSRIDSISADTTFDPNDGAIMQFQNTGATVRNVSASGNFPVGYTVMVHNVAASLGGIVFEGIRRLQPNTSLTAMYNGTNWIQIGQSGTYQYTRADLVTAGVIAAHADGEIVYCTGCNSDATCTAGAGNSIAIHESGVWTCQK